MRLSQKKDFKTLFARGMYFSAPLFTLRWRRAVGELSRFGFIVANTVSKKATARNTIRRRFRECVRRNLDKLPFAIDAAIIVKSKALGATSKEIEDVLLYTFKTMQQRSAEPRAPIRAPRVSPTRPKQ